MDGGLEVDRRNDLPISYQKHGEGDKYTNGMSQHHVNQEEHASQRPPQGKHFYGLRPTTFFLSIAFALALVLAVVAAGVAGSLAAKRDTRCVTQPTVPPSPQVVSNASCSLFNSSSLYSSSATVNPFHVNNSPFVPSSNCTALGDTYTSFMTQKQFRPLCSTNLTGSDFYSVFVYYFTDCIEACAAWNNFPNLNMTCYGVAYGYNYTHSPQGQYGNCWLKNSPNIEAVESNTTFSASLIQG